MDDEPIHLRLWGSTRVYELPAPAPGAEWVIGAATECWLRIQDPGRFVSKQHAALARHGSTWVVRDLDSKNGLWIDSARRSASPLAPGIELGIGAYRFIAESQRSVALRGLMARFLGWDVTQLRAVDRGLRAIRTWTMRRAPLALIGEGDLIAVARRIHREAVGTSRPFVTCLPRHRREPSAQAPVNYPRGVDALHAASGGTLCVVMTRPPEDLPEVLGRLDEPGYSARIVLCSRGPVDAGATSIRIPSLVDRRYELARIVDEYAADAVETLAAKPESFASDDRNWLLEQLPHTLAEIEAATARLVAIREWGTVTRAAARLGLSHAALSRWLARRSPR